MNLSHDIRMKTNRMALKWIFYSMLLATGLCGYNSAGAQTIHPVTASLQLVPPYSVYLADYAAPGNDKLRVILTLNDLSQPSYAVRLRLKVELNGRVIMQTDPAYRPSAITIMPGMPQIITGTQLNEYLVSDHLQFLNGFSRDNYERTKALPEGAYRICVTAYDYNRSDDVAISNDGCNIFFFQKKEAPLLNYPLCNSRVDRKDPQFLTFTWSIRNTPSFITGSSGTGYRFELFEVRPAGSNAEYIVRSSTPIYSVTTDNAMLVYGPGEPRLQDSMQYVWRVQAFDKDGRDAYQNNGYSQACVFTYGGLDPFVVNNIGKPELFGEALGERSGKWWWHIGNVQSIDGWNLQYRKADTTNSKTSAYDWNKKFMTDTVFHLFSLEPDNTYEAQVQPVIRGISGSWSEKVVFRTMPKRVYECGKNDTTNNGLGANAAGQPLNSAIAGMVVRVGDFDMQLLEVSGGNGRFSGYGAIATPLLGMRLNVKFADVQINDKLVLTQGEVVALTDGIDAWIKDRTKVNKDVETIKSWTEKMPDFETGSLGEIKDFAKELLGISDGIWNDTYVYTEEERKDVQAALAEVKAAMQELEDNDPTNDAAAEKKLRQTLKKVEPLLEKLSNNIGKGVLVKLGLTRKKLYKAIVANYIKELKASAATTRNDLEFSSHVAKHGPNNEDNIRWFVDAALPACMKSLSAEKQLALADYLQEKVSADEDWDTYAAALQQKIEKQEADETLFKNVETEIADKEVSDWAALNGSRWNDANEHLCSYVLDDYDAAQQQMDYLNTFVIDPDESFLVITLPSKDKVFPYGVQVRFYKDVKDGKDNNIIIDGKEYKPLYSSGDQTFKGFYDISILAKVEQNKDGTYSTKALDEKKGWLKEDGNYKVISQLKKTYSREFFEDMKGRPGVDLDQAMRIAQLIEKINKDVYNEYLKVAWYDRTDQEKAWYDIGVALSSVEDFQAALKRYVDDIENRKRILSNAARKWYTTPKEKDSIRNHILKKILWQFRDADYLSLNNAQRDSVLHILTDGNLHSWNLGDQIAMKLVTRVPDVDQKGWLDIISKGSCLSDLFTDVDGDEFNDMMIGLSKMVMDHFKKPENFTLEDAIADQKYLIFKEGLFTGNVLEESIDENGNIIMKTRRQFTWDLKKVNVKATEWIIVDFRSPFKLNDKLSFVEGAKIPMPAILAYAMFNEENNRRIGRTGKFVFDIALTAVGLYELRAAVQAASALEKALRVTKAVVDLAVGVGDIIISDVLLEKLNASPQGKKFLSTWNTIQLYYGIGSIGAEVGMYVRNLYKQGKEWKNLQNFTNEDELAEKMNEVLKGVQKETGIANTEENLADGLDALGSGWLLWSQYPKKVINGEEFAVVGTRYYSKEAVEQAVASQFSLPTIAVNEVLENGSSFSKVENGVTQKIFDKDNLRVVTEDNGTIVRTLSKVDFDALDIPNAMAHVKFRDLTDAARRDIVGCHDAVEFTRIRQTSAIGNPGYQVTPGKRLYEVEEIIIIKDVPHASVPGVRNIEYKVPALTGNTNPPVTTGALKGSKGTDGFKKTVYDPAIWTDDKLKQAFKEAFQDANIKNKGVLSKGGPYQGKTRDGYTIEFYYRNDKIQTFYFVE